MGSLILLAALTMLPPVAADAPSIARSEASLGSQPSSSVRRWQPYISEASRRFGIPEDWIARVIQAESGGQTALNGRPIMSHAGAMGLMQLMPGTWAEMRNKLGLGRNPHDPRDNILAGTAYLREMHDRFGYPGLFAAYNAGPERYARHLATGAPLPGETRSYLATLTNRRVAASQNAVSAPPKRLFFTLESVARPASNSEAQAAETLKSVPPFAGERPPSAGLFVPLTNAPEEVP